ncbi:hypothetical protein Y032_0023g861 [Ancylostoma ceylanicum]|uniref:Uncharacterized protein n=1 Tax=Ancylostoma ceylanicum TaxID=53326 RepID=A0A016UXH0_9BILA|nr:hypothetical protein Y032_0023g861 [Ancylostoma ceylanicum]
MRWTGSTAGRKYFKMAGEGRVQRVIDVRHKYFRRTPRMVFKAAVGHIWHDQISQAVLEAGREHRGDPRGAFPDEVQEMMVAEDV